MTISKEIDEISKAVFTWLLAFIGLFILFFSIGTSGKFFEIIQHDLLPKEMQLIVTNPLNALLVQIEITVFLAFVVSLPLLLYKIISYLSPALRKREKKIIVNAILPSMAFFALGISFAYFLLIPSTFEIMNSYVFSVNALPFFEINEFVSMVIALTLATGFLFLLPVFMKVLNALEIVDKPFWISNFKYAFIMFLIFSAIITPDGTGMTMLLLSLPLTSLYFLGWVFSKNINTGKRK